MINIRSLFDRRRFADCENPRQTIGDFASRRRLSLSLFCEETDEGIHLLINDMGIIIPAKDYPFPEYIHERIECWNAWASHALETEWENSMSPYGLEAYGAAIAINISSVCKGHLVDWCGLQVHDDYALLKYREKLYKEGRLLTEAPDTIKYNRYIRELHHAATEEFEDAPKRSLQYLLYDAYDEGHLYYYETAKAPEGAGNWNKLGQNLFDVSTKDGFPEWMSLESDYCGEIYGCETHAEYLYWVHCSLLFNFRLTALGIDVMRYLRTSMPVVASHLYIAYPENFPLAIMRPTVVL